MKDYSKEHISMAIQQGNVVCIMDSVQNFQVDEAEKL